MKLITFNYLILLLLIAPNTFSETLSLEKIDSIKKAFEEKSIEFAQFTDEYDENMITTGASSLVFGLLLKKLSNVQNDMSEVRFAQKILPYGREIISYNLSISNAKDVVNQVMDTPDGEIVIKNGIKKIDRNSVRKSGLKIGYYALKDYAIETSAKLMSIMGNVSTKYIGAPLLTMGTLFFAIHKASEESEIDNDPSLMALESPEDFEQFLEQDSETIQKQAEENTELGKALNLIHVFINENK